MATDKKAAAATAVYLNKTPCLCSSACHKALSAEPQRYVNTAAASRRDSTNRPA